MTVVALLFASVLWPTVLLAAPLGEGRLPLDVAAGTNRRLQVMMDAMHNAVGENPLMAYLAMMAVRPCSQWARRETRVASSVWSSAAVGSSRMTTEGSCSHSRAQPIDWR